ncbi:hypothetical protein ACIB24_20585 [Spongisporangium articulatum]|uniref:ABC-2 type transport system permease protein n=1 Tax=Spongisporangium articulatum TaxID=3362603 RepID=A0ABW8ASU1_9ACTN
MSAVSPSAWAQTGALVRFRAARAGPRVAVGLGVIVGLLLAAAPVGTLLPSDGVAQARLLLPTAWLGFGVTVLIAAATGGSRMLVPRDGLVAVPVEPGTEHLVALLLAPLNLAWIVETLGLLALAGWVYGEGRLTVTMLPGLALTLLWVLACTVVAQCAGWLVELARTTRSGPWLLRGLVVVAIGGGLTLAVAGAWPALLDSSPLVGLAFAGLSGTAPLRWAVVAGGLLVATLLGLLAGPPLVRRVQRRPPRDLVSVESRTYPARPDPASLLAGSLRIDRAGVWRSAPLRRGLATLAVAPGAAAAAAGLDWPMLVLMPGLVAAGAGLLFGVNAFSLDGRGALWRESLPGGARDWLRARFLVIAEISLGAALLATVLGALRAPTPHPADVVAVVAAAVATTAQVLGACARWSLRHPYAAHLREPRDQPAPPLAMAGYSARLAIRTTVVGLLLSACARGDLATYAALIGVAVTCWSLRPVARALEEWQRGDVRARVVATVAAG